MAAKKKKRGPKPRGLTGKGSREVRFRVVAEDAEKLDFLELQFNEGPSQLMRRAIALLYSQAR